MNTPNSHTRLAYAHRSVAVAGLTLDLYPPPHGKGSWTPASTIFRAAGIPEADEMDFRRQHGMTNTLGGFEIAWDNMRPEHTKPVALLSPNAVEAVLMIGRERGSSTLDADAEGAILQALRD